jgi:hypothetical protein
MPAAAVRMAAMPAAVVLRLPFMLFPFEGRDAAFVVLDLGLKRRQHDLDAREFGHDDERRADHGSDDRE